MCCKDLFTGLVLVTVDTRYSLAWSCKLIQISVRGAGRICRCKACSCRTYSSRYMLPEREATHSHQCCCAVGATMGRRDHGGTLAGLRRGPCAFGAAMQCKGPSGPPLAGCCFTDFTFELHLQHLITNI